MPARMIEFIRPGLLLFAALSLFGLPARAVDLCVKEGTITLSDGEIVDIWGYAEMQGADCADEVTSLPGPVIRAAEGATVTITLHNDLGVSTSLLIPGQSLACTSGCTAGDFTGESAAGATTTYTLTDAAAGTYIYESGTNAQIQVAMGLHGALVIDHDPLDTCVDDAPKAYAGDDTCYDKEAVLVLSEIDPDLNADPANFEFIVEDTDPKHPTNFVQNYRPVYWLINGRDYPSTDGIAAGAGDRVLLRYVNGSFTHHSMASLGVHQNIVAREGFELPTVIRAVAETIPAGTTADMIPVVPDTASLFSVFPIYNRNMRLTNASSNDEGGMQTAIQVGSLNFSTVGSGNNAAIPGVSGAYDDADIYTFAGGGFVRRLDGSVAGLANNANIDGLKIVDADTFYVSFFEPTGTTLPGGAGTAEDEDIVLYDAGSWSIYFDGSTHGLAGDAALNIDAFDIDLDSNTVYFSTAGDAAVGALANPDNIDIYSWDGSAFARVLDGSANGIPNNTNVNGLKLVDSSTLYLSFDRNVGTSLPGPLTAQDEDVVLYDGTSYSLVFDGSGYGLADHNQQGIDAIDIRFE